MGRGKTRPLVKRFPPVRRLHWKKAKTLAMLANRRQHTRQFGTGGAAQEILTEAGVFVITQSSSDASPNYIITE